MKKYFLVVLVFHLVNTIVSSQNASENTLSFDSTLESPKATLEDVQWIQGHWQGQAFGGIVEEIWSPPLGSSMMCVFKLVVDGKVKFYEIVTISEENNTLMLRLKHFSDNLVGWEEKDETIDFALVKVTENKVFFDGFTFEKIGEDEINVYVVISNEGKKEEAKFSYKRFK